MGTLLKVEELGLFGLTVYLFGSLGFPWWAYPVLLLAPDLGILGYAAGPKVGAITYNLAHHKAVAVILYVVGMTLALPGLSLAGLVILGHSSLDRVFGYGLKHFDSFRHTHLGWIGRGAAVTDG
ncbi:MAG: DUF4260 domain-containing protein [Anaerolineales bacterium]